VGVDATADELEQAESGGRVMMIGRWIGAGVAVGCRTGEEKR
jgi:hypothetical protein